MKKLITVFVLFLGLGLGLAQEKKPTFEETVIYIDNIVGKNKSTLGYNYVSKFTAKKNGEVTFDLGNSNPITMNLLNMTKDIYLEETTSAYRARYLSFTFIGDDKYILSLRDDKFEHLQRLKKAFEHLRSLCTKEKDPFGN